MTLDRMKLSAQTVRDNIAILEEVQEPDDAGYYLQLEHEKFVLECIEKQIPKKPKKKNPICYAKTKDGQEHFTFDYFCPNCNEQIKLYEHHCKCGQALDWSDTE